MSRIERCEAWWMAVAAIAAASVLGWPARAGAEITIAFVSPTANQLVNESVVISTVVTSDGPPVATVTAEMAGRSLPDLLERRRDRVGGRDERGGDAAALKRRGSTRGGVAVTALAA